MTFSVYCIAGEASGDALGAGLIKALRAKANQPMVLHGVGGPAMIASGLTSLFPMKDLSVMGVFEVLPRLPLLLSRIKQTARDIIAKQPNVVVTIDSPDFCHRVIKRVRKQCPNTKFIHYVAPTVWAWRPERAQKLATLVDGVMCLFPFEPAYFTPYGLKAVCVGHPAVALAQAIPADKSVFCDKYDLIEAQMPTAITLLFGSRLGELRRLGHVLFEAAQIILTEWPSLTIYVPAVPHLLPYIKQLIGRDQRFVLVDPQDRYMAISLSGAALATSGTIGLELAMLNVPHSVAYKLNPLTLKFARRMVKVKFMHLVNILLNRLVVPEFLQEAADPAILATTTLDLLADRNGAATGQRLAFNQARALLNGAGHGTPSEQAAAFVLSLP